jgi:hypothetical protein
MTEDENTSEVCPDSECVLKDWLAAHADRLDVGLGERKGSRMLPRVTALTVT